MTDAEAVKPFRPDGGIDKVRASKAGHAFHEAWAARSALQLLVPNSKLAAITLEGFDAVDETDLGTGAVEIADLVRYYDSSDVGRASRVEIVQFKYSIANADLPVRAADVAKTLAKFAETDKELRERHGNERVERVVKYEFATNRPIHPNLLAALAESDPDAVDLRDVAKQRLQLAKALEAYPFDHGSLLGRLTLLGTRGSLKHADRSVAQVLASWSEASDPDAELRLLKLRNLVRIKAGPSGTGDNRIDRVAVLAELGVHHEDQLYPTQDAFPPVGTLIDRPVLERAVTLVKAVGPPLLIHGAGGMGKTVLMQGLAKRLGSTDQVIIFDGFGGGHWRDPSDGRHRPEQTLVHLANLLAGRTLCDILLPISDITSLLRAFRRRLKQSVATARQMAAEAQVVLILDAIDHAAIAADATGTTSFAHVLLASLTIDPIDGVALVASCRTERRLEAVGDAEHRELEIPAFSADEATRLIAKRDPSVTGAETAALHTRSGGNPRCLDTLLTDGRPYDPPSAPGAVEVSPAALLDDLLKKRLDTARRAARDKGASDADIDLLLTGLALLPPPAPLEELAAAHGIPLAQVESFAADLAPLLERTAYGLMFRDEPTETLIRRISASDETGRDRVIATLSQRQSESSYAARALPALLTSLRYTDQLVALAFDERVPPGASKVSLRDIRMARITAALDLCAKVGRRDDLLRLLLEASIVAAGHERSDRFLYEFPDLAAVANDPEGLRRLFSTKAGWPGGRHSALGLAQAFMGDMGEARRNAHRAIDWHNWASQNARSSAFDPGKTSTEWDDVGFAYVEILAGNDTRVARFFADRGDDKAHDKFGALFDLLERQRCSGMPPSDQVAGRLRHCRLPSRALWAAALEYSDRDPEADRRLIRNLASASPKPETPGALPGASLTAVARALDLGMPGAAQAILDAAAIARPRLYDFTSYWAADRDADIALLSAGLRAALSGKPVTLVDLLPNELLDLVAPSIRARGAAAVEKALRAKLGDTPPVYNQPRRRRRKPRIPHDTRSEYHSALTHRIAPLVPCAQAIADIVRAPAGEARQTALNAALDQLEQGVEQASTYPYRDGKAYRARVGFRALFLVADAIGALDEKVAGRLAAWLPTAPGMFTPQILAVITRLSREPACHDAALVLAAHAEKQILLDTDIGSRVSSYGALARAVWRVSIHESAAYFRRTLDLADAIGSDDFDRTNHLLELASHYAGPRLSPRAGHDLARILELNQNEDSKFPWVEYAQTMVPVAGLDILAMTARLDDREKADLGLSLGPALTVLLRYNRIPSDVAASLFGLAAPGESWTWRTSDFVKAVLPGLAPERREWLFGLIVVEIDRDDQLAPSRDTAKELLALAETHLPANSPSRIRIAALVARRAPGETPSFEKTAPNGSSPELSETALGDPEAIDRAILQEDIGPSGRRWPQRTLSDLAGAARKPAVRLAFVNAVAGASAANLSDKLHALEDHLPQWSATSVALKDDLPRLALVLAEKHASELVSSDSAAWSSWRTLHTCFDVDRPAAVERVVTALAGVASEVAGDSWLALAAKLAPHSGSSALGEGLERFLSLSGDPLPAEVGDGAWDDRFVVSDDPVDVAAGLIWSRLGHGHAAMRWRAAHAVRRLAEAGRFDVIGRLVDRYETRTVMPFGDAKLPSYPLHARLWLLIALARAAKDWPDQLRHHSALFERIAFSEEFPHVVLRAFAADALSAIAPRLGARDRKTLLARLKTVNKPALPPRPKEGFTTGRYAPRPEDAERPPDAFHLDYDFNKYQTERLCHVFGCGGWEIEDAITRWVRRWDEIVPGMYDCPRGSDREDRSWSSGSVPVVDNYGGYLGWHALMLVAGEMAASRPVTGRDWGGDSWKHFLAEYRLSRSDGLWLSEATDPFPLDLPKGEDLPMPEADARVNEREDHALLAPLVGIAGGMLGAPWMPVMGRWSLTDETSLSLSTVLGGREDARAALMTALTDEPFFRWLPRDDEEIPRDFGRHGHSMRAWIDTVQHAERQFDHHDPYAAKTALNRPSPAGWVRKLLTLRQDDPVGRSWSDAAGRAFTAESWGATGGRGEYAWEKYGERISVERSRLLGLLGKTGLTLVGLVKLQRYHKRGSPRAGSSGVFTHRSYVFVLDASGRVWAPLRASNAARAAVQALVPREGRDFRQRFKAIKGR